ncbi:urea active transporter, putative [Talaromyces stipitatus ATCC 10500]|uniref:Urea active transporter, putative n=1 Tax=Talaromyces stipitatus (strain ATCC 10500 / CBS 375.48 / QM 6759 / NRRL 1006) TaxID=441959 RepID=B8M1Z9_TALSN|nr:urea active transporter, putative [Talaromyces stipitatus ATCC 10500]EED21377.1 urea active transporter, putative [Talaromyces stipitatus ATCC 10500]
MSSESLVPLSQGAGYGVVVGIGLVFGIGMVLVNRFLERYLNEKSDHTEMFMVANRSVGTGLTASAVVSSWMWATAIIWTTAQGYLYGIAAPFWYAAGVSIQIALMTVLAIHAKVKVPNGHTVLEIVRLRYGTAAHIIYIFLCFATNLLSVTAMILGAAGVITSLTGMHIVASTFLLPLGVIVYTVAGGLKATFLTDYVHTLIVMVILAFLTIKVINNSAITGLSSFYDVLVEADKTRDIPGNYKGSILSFKSKSSIIFGLVHSFGDFALVLWIRVFGRRPGYMLGGIAYFAVPWAVGTTTGLAAIALERSPIFPTYPRLMTTEEINAGYVLPYTVMAIAGKGGAWALLLVVFMCVTSTTSAELIAVSSIFSFDIYRTYINPKAQDHQVIRVSHWTVIVFGVFASAFATALHYGGIDLNWMGYFLATIICPGMFPLAFTILWKKQSAPAATIAPLLGLASGIAVWLGTAYAYSGELSILSTEAQLPCLWGALTSTFSSAIYSIPDDFDWRVFLLLSEVKDESDEDTSTNSPVKDIKDLNSVTHPYPPQELKRMNRAATLAAIFSAIIGLVTWVVWPLPLYRDYIFGKSFFMGWTAVSEIWLFFCILVAVVYPVVDGRKVLARAFTLFYQSLSGKKDLQSTSPQGETSPSPAEVKEAAVSVQNRSGVLEKSD